MKAAVLILLLVSSSLARAEPPPPPPQLSAWGLEVSFRAYGAGDGTCKCDTPDALLGGYYARHLARLPIELSIGAGMMVVLSTALLYGKLGVHLDYPFTPTTKGYLLAEIGGFGGSFLADESSSGAGGWFLPLGIGVGFGQFFYADARWTFMELNHQGQQLLTLGIGLHIPF